MASERTSLLGNHRHTYSSQSFRVYLAAALFLPWVVFLLYTLDEHSINTASGDDGADDELRLRAGELLSTARGDGVPQREQDNGGVCRKRLSSAARGEPDDKVDQSTVEVLRRTCCFCCRPHAARLSDGCHDDHSTATGRGEDEDDSEVFAGTEHETKLLNAELDSLDYDNCENELYLEEESSRTHNELRQMQFARWIVMLLIGVFTGLIASLIDYAISKLSDIKFSLIQSFYESCTKNPTSFMLMPLGVWLLWNIGCVLCASILTAFVEPVAAGSGIPQVKCFLNGVKIPHIVRIKTLFCKVLGVTLSVLGGLTIGKEGPMIHSGAVVAAGVSQGRSTTFGFDLKIFEYFRTDTEKRDFVSGGAAAGVSAAFGAPVGGVLFSLEEGASFWNQALTWRIFFASMISTFTLNLIKSLYTDAQTTGVIGSAGLINFGKFQDMSYSTQEVPAYILMAVIGGLLGALFNYINIKLTIFRRSYVRRRWMQCGEAVIIATTTTIVAFLMILLNKDCHARGTDDNANQIQMYCPDGSVSSMSILWFQSPEASVKSLFHDPHGTYDPVTLTTFAFFYFFLAVWTYGASVPSGLFIPGLVIGAAWGRLLSIACLSVFPNWSWVDPGKFALVGAAAQLGGVVRMTLSLTVILIEATGNIGLGLPLMIVLMVAKWVGDIFTEGIYDMHIELQGVPVLGWEPPSMSSSIMAREVMSYPVTTMRGVEKVSTIVNILTHNTHDGFPIVHEVHVSTVGGDGGEGGHRGSGCGAVGSEGTESRSSCVTFGLLTGIISRSQLIVLLRHKYFVDNNNAVSTLRLSDFRAIYPRFPKIQDVDVDDADMSRYIDLRPFMNPAPYSVFDNTSLPRIFKLFRGLGLRHLVVVNKRNEVIGIVTRKDLARYHFHKGRHQLRELQMTTG